MRDILPAGNKSTWARGLPPPLNKRPSRLHGNSAASPEEHVVPELLTAQAAERPDALAVAAGARLLSYRDLEIQSNRLAHHLQSLGVAPGSLVGLCLGRSPAMIVDALGILKAGAAYLPVDPSYPRQRISFMLRDARVSVVITDHEIRRRLSGGEWKLVAVDDEMSALARYSGDPLRNKVRPQNLAYVIYTSGSTGQPKGVEISHGNLLHLIRWHQRAFRVTSADRATQLSSPGFDAAVWELWPHLTAGASVHQPDEGTRLSPESLRDWMVAQRITISFVPTALAERLISIDWPSNTALRILLTGADTLQHYPPPGLPFTLVNNYGPTECTVVATSGAVRPNEHPATAPPIGRPIENVQICLLDENLRSAPAGEPGEIYIGGRGVSRGYINHPELTAERFVANPFGGALASSLYRTGDRARFLPDGQLEFLGRIDDQVKVRGYRIELNEIGCALGRHPSVQSSVVIAREDARGGRQLVAYVVPNNGNELSETELREHARASLPEYMVPAVFVLLSSLPVTPNGKIDRRALPEPNTSNTIRDRVFDLPHTPTEKKLAKILSTMFETEKVGASDNFFLLGGHSLLGTQLISRIRACFGVELSLRALFDHATVSGLAAEIDRLVGT